MRTADAIELICTSEHLNAALLAPDDQSVGISQASSHLPC
jgi:hypothetical protein